MASPQIQPKSFDSVKNDAERWLRRYDLFCNAMGGEWESDDARRRRFPLLLDDAALDWFERLPDTVNTWRHLKTAFLRRFAKAENVEDLVTTLMSMRQRADESTRAYVDRFDKVARKLDDDLVAEELMLKAFMRGMKCQFRVLVAAMGPTNLNEVYDMATRVEELDGDGGINQIYLPNRTQAKEIKRLQQQVRDLQVYVAETTESHGRVINDRRPVEEPHEPPRWHTLAAGACPRRDEMGHFIANCPHRQRRDNEGRADANDEAAAHVVEVEMLPVSARNCEQAKFAEVTEVERPAARLRLRKKKWAVKETDAGLRRMRCLFSRVLYDIKNENPEVKEQPHEDGVAVSGKDPSDVLMSAHAALPVDNDAHAALPVDGDAHAAQQGGRIDDVPIMSIGLEGDGPLASGCQVRDKQLFASEAQRAEAEELIIRFGDVHSLGELKQTRLAKLSTDRVRNARPVAVQDFEGFHPKIEEFVRRASGRMRTWNQMPLKPAQNQRQSQKSWRRQMKKWFGIPKRRQKRSLRNEEDTFCRKVTARTQKDLRGVCSDR